jgi:hypothetical protein
MKFNSQIAQEVCKLISSDHTLAQIEKLLGINRRDIYEWIRIDSQFRTDIARAREAQADSMADEIRNIAKKVQEGELFPEQGKVAANLLQWLAAKRKPKIYGDKMTLAGDAENPLFNLGKRMDALRERQKGMLPAPTIEGDVIEIPAKGHPGDSFA